MVLVDEDEVSTLHIYEMEKRRSALTFWTGQNGLFWQWPIPAVALSVAVACASCAGDSGASSVHDVSQDVVHDPDVRDVASQDIHFDDGTGELAPYDISNSETDTGDVGFSSIPLDVIYECGPKACVIRQPEVPTVSLGENLGVNTAVVVDDAVASPELVFAADGSVRQEVTFTNDIESIVLTRRAVGPTLAWPGGVYRLEWNSDESDTSLQVFADNLLIYSSRTVHDVDETLVFAYPNPEGAPYTLTLSRPRICGDAPIEVDGCGCRYPVMFSGKAGSTDIPVVLPGYQMKSGAGGEGLGWWWILTEANASLDGHAGCASITVEAGLW